MSNNKSVKEVCELFQSMEKKYSLLDMDIQGVKIWQYMRMTLYYKVSTELGILFQPHLTFGLTSKLKSLFSVLFSSLFFNPFYMRKDADALFIEHERHKKYQGKNIDIYSYFLQREMLNAGKKIQIIEPHRLGLHYKQQEQIRYHSDFIYLVVGLFRNFFVKRNCPNVKWLSEMVEKEISLQFGKKVNIKNDLYKGIGRFKIQCWLYSILFKIKRPKEVYVVVSYGQGDITFAAKKLGIPVVELQHGVISQFHLGYSFPSRVRKLDYFPDRIYLWSQYWKSQLFAPISADAISIREFDYLKVMREKYRGVVKKKQAIILSQGALGDRIAVAISKNLEIFSSLKLIYKLHPGEYGRYQYYKKLMELKSSGQVEVVEECDLYQIFAESQYQIGVFSTALFEGVEFGCKTILIDLPGIEYMKDFIVQYDVQVIAS